MVLYRIIILIKGVNTMTTLDRISEVAGDTLGTDHTEITADTLLEQIGGDSLEMVEFYMEIEEEFDMTIPEDRFESFKTFGDIVKYIEGCK